MRLISQKRHNWCASLSSDHRPWSLFSVLCKLKTEVEMKTFEVKIQFDNSGLPCLFIFLDNTSSVLVETCSSSFCCPNPSPCQCQAILWPSYSSLPAGSHSGSGAVCSPCLPRERNTLPLPLIHELLLLVALLWRRVDEDEKEVYINLFYRH